MAAIHIINKAVDSAPGASRGFREPAGAHRDYTDHRDDYTDHRDYTAHRDYLASDYLDETIRPTSTTPRMDAAVSRPATGVCVLEVAGELDTASAGLLTECVAEQLAAGPPRRMVIDLRAVTFLNAAGLGALMECAHRVRATIPDSVLILSGTTRRTVYRPLEVAALAGLSGLFSIHRSLADALAVAVAPARSRPAAVSVAALADPSGEIARHDTKRRVLALIDKSRQAHQAGNITRAHTLMDQANDVAQLADVAHLADRALRAARGAVRTSPAGSGDPLDRRERGRPRPWRPIRSPACWPPLPSGCPATNPDTGP